MWLMEVALAFKLIMQASLDDKQSARKTKVKATSEKVYVKHTGQPSYCNVRNVPLLIVSDCIHFPEHPDTVLAQQI